MTRWNWDSAQVIDNDINIVLQHSRDWNNGNFSTAANCLFNGFLLSQHSGFVLDNQVNLVLKDDDMLKLHDIDSNQMLSCLGLRESLITSDE